MAHKNAKSAATPPSARPRPAMQSAHRIDISKLIAHADLEGSKTPIYSNHIRCTSSTNELLLDFFRAGPDQLDTTKIKVAFLQRIIIPIGTAHQLGDAILKSVTSLEDVLKGAEPGPLAEADPE